MLRCRLIEMVTQIRSGAVPRARRGSRAAGGEVGGRKGRKAGSRKGSGRKGTRGSSPVTPPLKPVCRNAASEPHPPSQPSSPSTSVLTPSSFQLTNHVHPRPFYNPATKQTLTPLRCASCTRILQCSPTASAANDRSFSAARATATARVLPLSTLRPHTTTIRICIPASLLRTACVPTTACTLRHNSVPDSSVLTRATEIPTHLSALHRTHQHTPCECARRAQILARTINRLRAPSSA